MRLFHPKLIPAAVLTILGLFLNQAQAACNTVSSQTILPPDRSAPGMSVFVTLTQDNHVDASLPYICNVSFTPVATWTIKDKCNALVNAVNSCPVYAAAPPNNTKYVVSTNSCNINGFFSITGPDTVNSVSLGISNTGFNDFVTGVVQPDYEEEIVTPGCNAAPTATGNTEPMQAMLAIKGTATGVPIISGQATAVNVVFQNAAKGGLLTNAKVLTTPGMTAASIVRGLNAQLAQSGVSCKIVDTPFAAILCTQPSAIAAASAGISAAVVAVPPNGFGIFTSDTGIGVGNASAPTSKIMQAFASATASSAIVPLPFAATAALGGLLGVSFIVIRRRLAK